MKDFYSEKVFRALDVFPYGLAKSGEFTCPQVELLEMHGEAYKELAEGRRTPVNSREERFVAVCLGKRPPETQHERVWISFCRKAQQAAAVTAMMSCSQDDVFDLGDISLDDIG